MRMRSVLFVAVLAGCAKAPTLPGAVPEVDQNAPYPTLVPLGPILAAAAMPGEGNPAAGIDARVTALNARANGLRGPVLDPATFAMLNPPTPALQ